MTTIKAVMALTISLALLSSNNLVAEPTSENSQENVQHLIEISEINTEAQNLLSNGSNQLAYDKLLVAYRDSKADNQTLFFLGITAKRLKKFKECEKYLTELTKKAPNAPRVKLELAEVLYKNGNSSDAKKLLLEVKSTNPPERVGENIDSFIAIIDKGTSKSISAYIMTGLMYDTNTNEGPSTDTILIYGLPFTLSQDGLPNHDWASTIKAGVNFANALTKNTYVQAELGVNAQNYFNLNAFDYNSLYFSVGPSYRKRNLYFSTPYVFNILRYGHDQDYYYLVNGIAPQFGYQASDRLTLYTNFTCAWKKFLTETGRNSNTLGFSPSIRYNFDKYSDITLGGFAGRERAEIETYSNNAWGINIGLHKSFNKQWSASLSPSFLKTTYKGEDILFGNTRNDETISINGTINYLIDPINVNISISYNWLKNNSSIELYQFSRQQSIISIAKYF